MTLPGAVAAAGMLLVLVLLTVRPSLGILALALFYPFNEFVPRAPIPGVNSETLILTVAMLAGFARQAPLPPLRISAPIVAYFVVILFGWGITATWYSNEMFGLTNIDNLIKVKSLLFPTLAFFVVYFWTGEAASRRRMLEALTYTLLLVAIAAIVDWVFKLSPVTRSLGRASGLIFNPNGLGILIAMLSVIPLLLYRQGRSNVFKRGVFVAAYTLGMIALVLTLSRKAWISVVVVHAVWFFYVNRRLLVAGGVAFLVTLTLAYSFLPQVIQDRIGETFEPGQTIYQGGIASRFESSTAERIVLHRVGFQMFADSPIWGHGYSSVLILTPRYGARYGLLRNRNPHSIPVKAMAENGLLGLATLGWMVLVLFLVGRRLWRSGGDERALGAAFLASCAGVGISSLAATTIEDHQVSIYFWMLFGLVARAEVEGRREAYAGDEAREFHTKLPGESGG